MTKRKGVLQKLSLVSAVVSFALALATGVMLYLRLENTGIDNPISSSLISSTFFFVCVGVVLAVMGTADISSFKADSSEGK